MKKILLVSSLFVAFNVLACGNHIQKELHRAPFSSKSKVESELQVNSKG